MTEPSDLYSPREPMPDAEFDQHVREADAAFHEEIAAERLNDYAGKLPARFQGATFRSFETPDDERISTLQNVRAWADAARRGAPGLFLYGPVGSGKTHLAVAASKRLIQRGMRGRYLNVQSYLEGVRASFDGKGQRKDPRSVSRNLDFIVVDDIGVEKPTDWVREQVYSLIDGAYTEQVLLIVTSNLRYSELAMPESLDERSVSRILEVTDLVKVTGDWRGRVHQGRLL